MMCHLAMLESTGEGTDPTTWLEPVTTERYEAANDRLATSQ
jgi:hypothetical protein